MHVGFFPEDVIFCLNRTQSCHSMLRASMRKPTSLKIHCTHVALIASFPSRLLGCGEVFMFQLPHLPEIFLNMISGIIQAHVLCPKALFLLEA